MLVKCISQLSVSGKYLQILHLSSTFETAASGEPSAFSTTCANHSSFDMSGPEATFLFAPVNMLSL